MNPFPDGPYRVIYADPPWSFATWSHRGPGKGASRHYDVMSFADLKRLPVARAAGDDAALFLWVVQPMLREAMDLIDAWGFRFKTVAYAWVKLKGPANAGRLFYAGEDVRLGLGYHTRSGFEQCWLATRGRGYRRLSKGEAQVVFAPAREHSRKPDEIRASIGALTGEAAPRLEMFARERHAGWDAWGNETEKFNAHGKHEGTAA